MGTSNESKRNQDEEEAELIIPWTVVPYSVRIELIKKLNPDVTMSGNDWRMLASELGYTTGDINYIESEKDNNTAVLFKQYDTKAGASLNDVYSSLEKMQRRDCLNIIRNALPEIHQAFNKANESQMLHASRATPMMAPMGQFQLPVSSCSYPYAHHPTSTYGSHACCSCTYSLTAACHSHHLGTCSSPHLVQMPHPNHARYQALSQADTVQKTFEPSFSQPHHTMPSIHGCFVQPQPGCHGSLIQPLGSGSPDCSIKQSGGAGNQTSAHHGLPNFSPGPSSYRGSPTYSPNQNVCSLPLPNNISALDNSNLISSDSNSSDSYNGVRQKFVRQYSNECNIAEVINGDRRQRNNNMRETQNSRESIDQCCAPPHKVNGQAANLGLRPRNGYSSKFAEISTCVDDRNEYYFQDCEAKVRNESSEFVLENNHVAHSEVKTSLAQLEKLATVPDKFKPTNEYRTVVVEQRIEVEKRRDGKTSAESSASQSNKRPSASRNYQTNFSRNAITPDNSVEGFKSLSISKKPSPPNIKPVDNIKAYRNIEVFVTYSYDNESHGKQVLSLCRFLLSNGFACSVDVCEKKSSARPFEQLEWCRKKVLEADFILVCISQKYLRDISSTSSSFFSQTNERQLHTREIYELMIFEYLNNQHNYVGESNRSYTPTQRFVPLLFPNMTHDDVPPWMMNGSGSAYFWPKQFEDLAWMLTKPQERFIGRRRTLKEQLDERERNASDLEVASGMDMTNLMSGVLCSS